VLFAYIIPIVLIDLPGCDLDSPSISFVRDNGQVIELQNKIKTAAKWNSETNRAKEPPRKQFQEQE